MAPVRVFQQARARDTYQSLFRAARKVFLERGFDGASIAEIAAAAGVSVGTFYRYFTDKRHVFFEVAGQYIDEAQADVIQRLPREKLAGADLRKMCDAVLDVLYDHVASLPDMLVPYRIMALRDPEVAKLRASHDAPALEILAQRIERTVPRSVIPDPRAAAFVMYCATTEIMFTLAVRGQLAFQVDAKNAKVALREMLVRFLRNR